MAIRSPLGALASGLVAGVAGAALQSLFFRLTARVAPSTPKDVFEPPEPAQQEELATQTVARRLVEGVAARGPLSKRQKEIAGELVHYGYGAACGGLYGLVRETWPKSRGALGAAGFATLVWIVGDNTLLWLLRLAAPPHKYRPLVHGYTWLAHLVYGAGVWGSYELIDRADLIRSAALGLLLSRRLPRLSLKGRWRVARMRMLPTRARRALSELRRGASAAASAWG